MGLDGLRPKDFEQANSIDHAAGPGYANHQTFGHALTS
jgi:hypothetical protein